jgi:hypothetical protein
VFVGSAASSKRWCRSFAVIATVPDGIVALIIAPAENANDPKQRFCAGLMPAELI